MNFVAAILYAVSSTALLAVALAFARGGLSPVIAAVSLSCGALVAAGTLWRSRREVAPSKPPTPWEWAALAAFAVVAARIFLWLIFIERDEAHASTAIKVLSPNNLGDLSLHLTYINFLASGVSFWPDNPIFTGGQLTYPIGADLCNSLLTLVGVDPLRGLIWTGLAGSALVGAALWKWGRGFAVFGFLANGGLFGFAIFSTGEFADFQSIHAWKSFALALLATQRGLLFALPAGLALLCSWRTRWFAGGGDGWKLTRGGELLLYAAMPLFHLHTFLFLSLMLASWFVLHAPARRELALFVGAALVPASGLVLLVTGMLGGASVLGFKAGWMWADEPFVTWCGEVFGQPQRLSAALFFWPLNFGVLPIFVVLLGVTICRGKRLVGPAEIVFPAVGAFLLCCFVKFAPWEWDNTKIMVWSYLAVLPFLWTHLIARWPEWARVLGCGALFFSGFVSTLGGINSAHRGYTIASREELDLVGAAVRGLPVTERFAGAPTFNHPLLLCGRKMALGYLGHVSSHGLAWEQPAARLQALMMGEADWREHARALGVRYIFWGRCEHEDYPGSKEPWRETAACVALGDWGEVYDLEEGKIQNPKPEIRNKSE